jgi:hypothetical protein
LSEDIKNGTLKGGDLATNTVSTTRIVDETLRSEDIKEASVTGADVDESSLAEVPDAARLEGHTYSDIAENFDRYDTYHVTLATGTYASRQYQHGTLQLECHDDGAQVVLRKSLEPSIAWVDNGGANAQTLRLDQQGETIASGKSTLALPAAERVLLAVTGDEQGTNKLASDFAIYVRWSGSSCRFLVHHSHTPDVGLVSSGGGVL